jgi:hypothetical protein
MKKSIFQAKRFSMYVGVNPYPDFYDQLLSSFLFLLVYPPKELYLVHLKAAATLSVVCRSPRLPREQA